MITIKLPFTTDQNGIDTILKLQKTVSPIVRSAYCRFMDGNKQLAVRTYLRNTFPGADSWFLQSALYDGMAMATVDTNQKRPRIFGGKLNFKARKENKITSEEYKLQRLLPASSVGEAIQKGNRKFSIDN